jgi:hypothetical protein
MKWTPLPFPKCPKCNRSWASTVHLGCDSKATDVYVDDAYKNLQCQGCRASWLLINNVFKCSCGHTFNSQEVNSAIDSIEKIKNRLINQINSIENSEKIIQNYSKTSLQQWANSVSYSIAKSLGKAVSEVFEILTIIFKI